MGNTLETRRGEIIDEDEMGGIRWKIYIHGYLLYPLHFCIFFREASHVKNDVFLSNDLELCFARMFLSKLN